MSRPFRFAVNMLNAGTSAEWREKCRRAEALGYDVILVPDHLGMPAPFPSLVAAAEVTERPRVGTFVLNAGFWNPTLLAREVASTDQLTGGRLELGLGTGYVREEHERAGLPFGSPRERVDHLERTIVELDRLLADPEHRPAAAQSPRVPLLLGGNGNRVLRLTARHADIAGFTGTTKDAAGNLHLITPDALQERVAAYRGFAAGRTEPAELNYLVRFVAAGGDRRAKARELLDQAPGLAEDDLLAHPTALTGTVKDMAEQLRGHRERYGFTYFTVLEPALEAFAPVIEELRG
ncbi:LLM class F420-dependent oxidoreductase [Streptomyces hesseae]|uniref:LLM class F420-dependent oxidoreductase n=1 Tax=Streptomyces hesseae TaxID=3075519 RepID=A0ABU2SQ31_9ACTN|nr:LLM class F420-dependent oxidoreductase [Streptomyces sp. DSM 40473]MDT0451108.1 LLM class F420-dependent oxidoreductase [Streptomyces sp. DSM 40473]